MWSLATKLGIPEKLIHDPSYQKIIELKQETERLQLHHFFNNDIRLWTWWLNLGFSIIPLIIWYYVVDRKRILEIALYGVLILTIATFLDVAGATLVLWDYPDKLLPNLPLLPIDFVVIPVILSLVYQKYNSWKSFFVASVLVGAVFSFIAEPILVWLNLYQVVKWKYIYSFPIYIIIPLLVKWLVERLKARQV